MERQFHNTYKKASVERGITGENMLVRLESRLDSVVYRLNLAPSLRAARQLVTHGHFEVNGRRVDIPSYSVSVGDIVRVRDKSRKMELIHQAMRHSRKDRLVEYLELNKAKMEGVVVGRPRRDQIPITANEQLVVELYSR